MDSEHRHELKTNELAEWTAHFPEFLKKNRNQIIGIVLIAIAVFSYFGLRNRGQKAANKQQTEATNQILTIEQDKADVIKGAMTGDMPSETGFADSITMLTDSAKNAKKPLHGALVLIKKGEALRTELHYAIEDVDKEKIDSKIEEAKAAYDEALVKAKGNATLTAMATYGLGLCAEEIGDFDKAAETFKGIATNEAFEGTIFPAQAQFRLDVMEDHKKEFTFVVAPIIKGFDKAAMDAYLRNEIHIEGGPDDKDKPDTDTKPDDKDKPDTDTKPDDKDKPDTDTKPDDKDKPDTGKVDDMGPKPPEDSDTEQK